MATFKSFEEIQVWQQARAIDLALFKTIHECGISRDFKLRDQMLGSSGSVMDNIAEGFGLGGNTEFIRFLYISKGSCLELMSQCYRAFDRGYISDKQLEHYLQKLRELNNKLQALISYLSRSEYNGPKSQLKNKLEEPEVSYGDKDSDMFSENMEHGTRNFQTDHE